MGESAPAPGLEALAGGRSFAMQLLERMPSIRAVQALPGGKEAATPRGDTQVLNRPGVAGWSPQGLWEQTAER
jgi:hypothetical protein